MSESREIDLTIPLRDLPAAFGNPDAHLSTWIDPQSRLPVPYRILRKSIDARKRHNILFLYRVELNPPPPSHGMPDYPFESDPIPVKHPIVVGAGPAGLLAAWLLARAGCEPIILERGQKVGIRCADIKRFHTERCLNPESNYLFGEGGAGTYSDGKLYTRIKDPRCDFVLQLFAACGAHKEILYLQRPHIGSDILPGMVAKIRAEIERLGGTFRWGSRVESILLEGNACKGVKLAGGENLESPAVILAVGHSARDLIRNLTLQGVAHTLKPFQIGCRVEHPQSFVNHMQYGMPMPPRALPVPEYHITSRPQRPDLLTSTSFCMCPGGEIIPAVHEEGRLCTNGMSPYLRNLPYANAAIILSLENNFRDADTAFRWIESLETSTYAAGGGEWVCPAQDIIPFVRGESGLHAPTRTSYRMGLRSARLDQLLPLPARKSLNAAFRFFEKGDPGFAENGKLVGIETRISSPVRFTRRSDTLESESTTGLWLAGEGAGYAGGIMSAAVDGLRLVESVLQIALPK